MLNMAATWVAVTLTGMFVASQVSALTTHQFEILDQLLRAVGGH